MHTSRVVCIRNIAMLMHYTCGKLYAYVPCGQVNVRMYVRTIHINNTCSLHEVQITILGTITVTDLFLSVHVFI